MEMLVLAGGFGKRLKKSLNNVPKPLAPINDTPLLKLLLKNWVSQGQQKFIFLLHHQAEKIIEFLSQQSNYFGNFVDIDWIVEKKPLGTGGSVSNAIRVKNLSGSVLISNADTWLDGGLSKIKNIRSAAIAVVKVTDTRRFGSLSIDNEGNIFQFFEKNTNAFDNIPGMINAGLYKLPTKIFLDFDEDKFSLEEKILPELSKKRSLKAVILDGNFYDIGIPKDYSRFCEWYNEKVNL